MTGRPSVISRKRKLWSCLKPLWIPQISLQVRLLNKKQRAIKFVLLRKQQCKIPQLTKLAALFQSHAFCARGVIYCCLNLTDNCSYLCLGSSIQKVGNSWDNGKRFSTRKATSLRDYEVLKPVHVRFCNYYTVDVR